MRGGRRESQLSLSSDTSLRNPSPLCTKSTTLSFAGTYPLHQQLLPPLASSVALPISPNYIIQQDHRSALIDSDYQFQPISVTNSCMRTRTSVGELCELKIMSSSSPTCSEPQSCDPPSQTQIKFSNCSSLI